MIIIYSIILNSGYLDTWYFVSIMEYVFECWIDYGMSECCCVRAKGGGEIAKMPQIFKDIILASKSCSW